MFYHLFEGLVLSLWLILFSVAQTWDTVTNSQLPQGDILHAGCICQVRRHMLDLGTRSHWVKPWESEATWTVFGEWWFCFDASYFLYSAISLRFPTKLVLLNSLSSFLTSSIEILVFFTRLFVCRLFTFINFWLSVFSCCCLCFLFSSWLVWYGFQPGPLMYRSSFKILE